MKKQTCAMQFIFFLLVLNLMAVPMAAEPANAAQRADVMISMTTAKSPIHNNNLIQAKQQAVSDALDLAVKNAYASLVSQQVFATNLDFLYEQILSKTREYVIAYRELGGIERNGHYLAGVESKINMKLLEKTMIDARILDPNKRRPAILFFIAEKTPQESVPRHWWGKSEIEYYSVAEKVIVNQMQLELFPVVGGDDKRPEPAFYNIRFSSIYDVEAAQHLGRELKADLIIIGNVMAAEAINRIGQERTFNTQINLDIYNVETGDKVVISQVQAVVKSDTDAQGYFNATMKASQLAAADLIEKIDVYWQKHLRQEQSFDVKIEGDNFLTRFIALKNRIRQLPGLQNMQPKEEAANSAVMEVFYKGTPSQFANTIAIKTFDDFGLEIVEVTENLVVIRFVEKGQVFQDAKETDGSETPLPSDEALQKETIHSEPLENESVLLE